MTAGTNNLLTTTEAAALLEKHPQTLVMWRLYRRGPKFIAKGRRVWYRKEDVQRFKREQR